MARKGALGLSEIVDAGDYDSSFEGAERATKRFKSREELVLSDPKKRESLPKSSEFVNSYDKETGQIQRFHNLPLDAYSRHKQLINNYFLYHPGSTKQLKTDTSTFKRDIDVIKEHHKFLWEEDENDEEDTWEKRLARRYYDKLFKEYCIADLSRYKENKTGMRWRTEKEVVSGKGQFTCAARGCDIDADLTTWEVNFGYMEHNEKKNALVKLRLCRKCSKKLNYHHKKNEFKKPEKKRKNKRKSRNDHSEVANDNVEESEASSSAKDEENKEKADAIWSKPQQAPVDEDKLRNEEMDDFLEDMFF